MGEGYSKFRDLQGILAGVYRHYKGPLYQILGYSHNASDDNNPQVLYIGLELDPSKPGPRFATRDVEEFFELVCPEHDGVKFFSEEHDKIVVALREQGFNVSCGERSIERFVYCGPVYYRGYERNAKN